ncbi:MAG: DNA-3-methyladenine glycosylase [Bacteroidota bacterium]
MTSTGKFPPHGIFNSEPAHNIFSKAVKLSREFYGRSSLEVAEELLGKYLVRRSGEYAAAGKIVEVEAYCGASDPASHAYRGKTSRNEVMFRQGGYLYVYFIYGMYYCCNIVTGKEDIAEAVLIRGIEPVFGLPWLSANRFGRTDATHREIMNLTNGPGKICAAFDISMKDSGTDLCGDTIFLLDAPAPGKSQITVSGRIGITRAAELPWRFFIRDNPYVSGPRNKNKIL